MAEAASGGRTWWAHFEFTRINIELIILREKIEESLRFRREDASGEEAPGLSGPASVPGMDPAIVLADHSGTVAKCGRSGQHRFLLAALEACT